MTCHLNATLKTLRQSILVIGYGNELRGDDGVGQQVARIVESWGVPNMRSLAVHQLTPELAAELSEVDIVIFVDAYPATSEPTVQVQPIEPVNSNVTLGHTSNPQVLLAIAQHLYNTHPQAWWVMVPAVNFELGEQLSPITQQGIDEALEQIDYLIRTSNKRVPRNRVSV